MIAITDVNLAPTDVGGMYQNTTTSGGSSPSPVTYDPSPTPHVSGGGFTSPTFTIPGPTDLGGFLQSPDASGNSTTPQVAPGPISSANGGDSSGGGGTPVGGTGSDGSYFGQVIDLIRAQLGSGSSLPVQQFAGAPVVLPSGGKYGGAGGDGGGGASGGLRAVVVVGLLGAAGWFAYRHFKGA